MSLISFNLDRDVISYEDQEFKSFEISSFTAAQSNNVVAYMATSSSTGFLTNAQGGSTSISLSGVFSVLANQFFSRTSSDLPIAHDTSSTTGRTRAVQLGRTVLDDGILSGTVTAVLSFGSTTNQSFIDIADTAVTSTLGLRGDLVNKSVTSNKVGTIFYDWGAFIFHGGTGVTNFLREDDSASGFSFSANSEAGKIFINQLSFKTITKVQKNAFFCRAYNKEFNYTNNPTAFESTTAGTVSANLSASPVTFVTTVGLYNNDNELLAIAKVSPPARKDFYREKTFQIQLNF